MKMLLRILLVLLSALFLSAGTCVDTFDSITHYDDDGSTIVSHVVPTKVGKKRIYYNSQKKEYYYFYQDYDDNESKRVFSNYDDAEKALIEQFGEASQGGGCFTAETLVLTKHGAKKISDIVAGDKILTYNSNGELSTNKVSEALKFKTDHYYVINGQIKVTEKHRFFTKDGWKRVHDLQIGDLLQKSDGTFRSVFSKEFVKAVISVYNLEINNDHNFFVTDSGKYGYLVHNHGGGGK